MEKQIEIVLHNGNKHIIPFTDEVSHIMINDKLVYKQISRPKVK